MLDWPSGSASFILAWDLRCLWRKVTGPPWAGSQEQCQGLGGAHTHGFRDKGVRLGIQRPWSAMKLWEAGGGLVNESFLALVLSSLWPFYKMSYLWNEGGGEMEERLDVHWGPFQHRVLAVHWRTSTGPNDSPNRCQRHCVLRNLCK